MFHVQDVLDQSLYECGIEGKAALHRYWQNNMKLPAIRLHQSAVDLHEQYRKLTVSHHKHVKALHDFALLTLFCCLST